MIGTEPSEAREDLQAPPHRFGLEGPIRQQPLSQPGDFLRSEDGPVPSPAVRLADQQADRVGSDINRG
jgi:hypothetical protein